MSKIGTADIKGIMLGNTEISKAYLGSDIVFQKEEPPLPYISDGLVFHLDGEDATDTVWTDRVAGIVYTLQGASADGKGVTFSSGNNTGRGVGDKNLAAISPNVGTIEVCAWRRSARSSNYHEIIYTTKSLPAIQYFVDKSGTYVSISNRNTAPAPRMPISGKTLGKFTHSCNAARSCYNGTMVEVGSNTYTTNQVNYIAGSGSSNNFKGTIYQIRIYNRQLSEAEMKFNQEQDRKKYGIQF